MSLTTTKVLAYLLLTIGLFGLEGTGLPMAAVGAGPGRNGDQSKTIVRTERFDRDPEWQGYNNRIVPEEYPTITQDFGYSKTNLAGKAAGAQRLIPRRLQRRFYCQERGKTVPGLGGQVRPLVTGPGRQTCGTGTW